MKTENYILNLNEFIPHWFEDVQLIEDTYVFFTKSIQDWADNEGLIAEKIKFYIMENYSEFYLKDIYTKTDKAIMLEFKNIVQNDSKLKAYFKAKTEPMITKLYSLQYYTDSKESLISELEESLKGLMD